MNKILKNKDTLLTIVFLSIMVNLFKTASVFRAVSFPTQEQTWLQWSYALLSVFILEICVLVFVSRGRTIFAGMFAFITAVVNLFYFNGFLFTDWRENIVQVFFSFLFPLVVYFFSEEYNKELSEENRTESENNRIESEKVGNLLSENRTKTEQIKRLSEINAKQTEELNQKDKELFLVHETLEEVHSQGERIRKQNRKAEREIRKKSEQEKKQSEKYKELSVDAQKWRESTTCPFCNSSVKSPQGLNSHKSKCAMNPKNIEKQSEQLQTSSVK